MKLVPREDWGRFPHLLIWHGRRVCDARRPGARTASSPTSARRAASVPCPLGMIRDAFVTVPGTAKRPCQPRLRGTMPDASGQVIALASRERLWSVRDVLARVPGTSKGARLARRTGLVLAQ